MKNAVLPDLNGKTFVVTGANTGIGRVTAETLADKGARVWLACRSEEKTRPVLSGIRTKHGEKSAEFITLDLGDLASVRAAAKHILDTGETIDVLVNNAGLAGAKGLTRDGFEMMFGVNHLGPFLFTSLLLPKLRERPHARIVNVASHAHYQVKKIDWSALRQPTASRVGLAEYGVSKLCNVLHANELAKKLGGTGVTTYSLHPGVVATDVWRHVPGFIQPVIKMFMLSNEDGAQTTLHCATTASTAGETGLYYDKCAVRTPSSLARDESVARELWDKSTEWSGAEA